MLAGERRQRLAELVRQRGFASLAELTAELDASESTIRRDLDSLDRAGIIRRTHGGAMAATDPVPIPAFEVRTRAAATQKRLIGKAAADLVTDGETVLLDGGTTTFEVARCLAGRSIQVVTNSLPIAHLLAGDPKVDLTLVGGYVYPRTGVAVGPLAVQFLTGVHARRLFMSTAGVTQRGLFNSNTLLVETQLQMMQAVDQVVLVADHTKFGQQSLAYLCPLDRVHRVVVDAGLGEQHRQLIRDVGAELIVAGKEAS